MNIGDRLQSFYKGVDTPIYIFSPYISPEALKKIVSTSNTNKISIITTWKPDDLKSGISSLELYELCKRSGWTLYINSRLHAKIYSISFDSCYIGSSNCTDRALFQKEGNIECFALLEKMSKGNSLELTRIINSSILIDDRVYDQYLHWFEQLDADDNKHLDGPQIENITPYYVFQLPATSNPRMLWTYLVDNLDNDEENISIEHDLAIYSTDMEYETYDHFISDVRKCYFNHPFIKKLDKIITSEGVYFGYFKEWIQNNCVDVPVPYRSDLTKIVNNLYEWFVELMPEKYYYDIPGKRSQVLYKRI